MSDADALEFRIDEVLDKLEVLGFEVEQYCDGESHDPFEKELRRGWHSALFRTICVDLCKQLAMFSKLGDQPHCSTFEVSDRSDEGVVRRLDPFVTSVVDFPSHLLPSKLNSFSQFLQFLELLTAEVQASRVLASQVKRLAATFESEETVSERELMKLLTIRLRSASAYSSQTPEPSLSKDSVHKLLQQIRSSPYRQHACFAGVDLSESQLAALSELNNELRSDYKSRREVLLNRLRVTLLGFSWSEVAKVVCGNFRGHG